MKKMPTKPLIVAALLTLNSTLSNAQFLGLPIPSIGDIAPAGLVTSLTSVGVGQALPIATTLLFDSPLSPLIIELAPQADPLTSLLLGNPLEQLNGLIPSGGNPLEILSLDNPLGM
ncbi:hypothetical protein [Zhongshania sp. BJYM1]|uniref:hypothetical protein n=1 Tax=Zhongshania aquatica TaxID=2965069 RepID=UPI0022B33CCB|nr:hypothetical protein [Marortus sp. BJYM1]